jgi:hypothetical protein
MTVGIAVDEDAERGLAVLREIGEFDEQIVGGGWFNTGAVRYALRDFAGVVAVPQLLILSRQVNTRLPRTVGADSLHTRLVGAFAIARWADRLERSSGQ